MTVDHPLITTDLEVAVQCIIGGGLVAIPTETVYGLAASATDPDAVERIFALKGRPSGHPLIVHIASAEDLDDWAAQVPDPARRLATTCWPGPLSVIVPRGQRVIDVVTGGRDTVAVRVPAHRLTEQLLAATGPLAAPSANLFGQVSPTSAQHVLADLGHLLEPGRDVILDGGPCPIGVESTIVDCTVDPPQVLRPGGISPEEVARILDSELGEPSGPSRASGMLASHYAPRCSVVLADTAAQVAEELIRARNAGLYAEALDAPEDLVEQAQTLYASLRAADQRGVQVLVAQLPPAAGLGHAIRDRLRKAAASDPPEHT